MLILGISMRLFLIIRNTITFNHRVILLLRYSRIRLSIQKTCSIKIDLFQIIIN